MLGASRVGALRHMTTALIVFLVIGAFSVGVGAGFVWGILYVMMGLAFALVCSAWGAKGRGMKSVGIRLAKAVNRVLGRTGAVLLGRYHVWALKTPREVVTVQFRHFLLIFD